jgi:hypothetical protein
LVILLTGARYESDAEFDIHVDEARRAGVGWDVIRSIPGGMLLPPSEEEEDDEEEDDDGFSLERVKERVIPALMREHDGVMLPEIRTTRDAARESEVAIVLFASELLDKNTVCDKTYDATRDRLHGCDSALVEIVAIVGYCAFVSCHIETILFTQWKLASATRIMPTQFGKKERFLPLNGFAPFLW